MRDHDLLSTWRRCLDAHGIEITPDERLVARSVAALWRPFCEFAARAVVTPSWGTVDEDFMAVSATAFEGTLTVVSFQRRTTVVTSDWEEVVFAAGTEIFVELPEAERVALTAPTPTATRQESADDASLPGFVGTFDELRERFEASDVGRAILAADVKTASLAYIGD